MPNTPGVTRLGSRMERSGDPDAPLLGAKQIDIDSSVFSGNLDEDDDTVEKIALKLDQLTGLSGGFTHTQSSASATWTINHNLGYKPSVDLFSVGGVEIVGTVTHISDNQVVADFVTSIAGFARLI